MYVQSVTKRKVSVVMYLYFVFQFAYVYVVHTVSRDN